MRQLVIAVLGISLGAAVTAHAQPGYGGFGGFGEQDKKAGTWSAAAQPSSASTGNWGVAPPAPYRPHSAPDYTKPVGSTSSIGSGEGFKPYKPPKPFKGSSVYGPPKPPAKPKYGSTY